MKTNQNVLTSQNYPHFDSKIQILYTHAHFVSSHSDNNCSLKVCIIPKADYILKSKYGSTDLPVSQCSISNISMYPTLYSMQLRHGRTHYERTRFERTHFERTHLYCTHHYVMMLQFKKALECFIVFEVF